MPEAPSTSLTGGVVIYGTGSPLLVDVEESLFRAGILVRAGVQNYPGATFLSGHITAFTPDAIADAVTLRSLEPLRIGADILLDAWVRDPA